MFRPYQLHVNMLYNPIFLYITVSNIINIDHGFKSLYEILPVKLSSLIKALL